MAPIQNFKLVCTVAGVIYSLLASSMLVRGSSVLRDFGISESLASEPLVRDFFSFFYLLMAFIGVLTVLFGYVTRERKSQLIVASVFCLWHIMTALRDLKTSDSSFGNHLYKGDATLVFVYISLAYAAAFGYLIARGLLSRPA